MSKPQVIEAICQHNRSADANFLIRFEERELRAYLDRLVRLRSSRGRQSVWVRDTAAPAVIGKAA